MFEAIFFLLAASVVFFLFCPVFWCCIICIAAICSPRESQTYEVLHAVAMPIYAPMSPAAVATVSTLEGMEGGGERGRGERGRGEEVISTF